MDYHSFILSEKTKDFVENEETSQANESVPDFQIDKSDHLSGLNSAKNDKSLRKFRKKIWNALER